MDFAARFYAEVERNSQALKADGKCGRHVQRGLSGYLCTLPKGHKGPHGRGRTPTPAKARKEG